MYIFKYIYYHYLLLAISFCVSTKSLSAVDTSYLSNKLLALQYLSQQSSLPASPHWPNVSPGAFVENLRLNVQDPLSLYEGRGTNFCSYAALSYIPLNQDPLAFAQFMVQLYQQGSATMGDVSFKPSKAIKKAAGTFHFKGKLDARPAEQMWFLLLADHFKGYLNFFHRTYKPGSEDGFWAATNFAKFNRMVRKLFHHEINAVGSDIIRPGVNDIVQYISGKMASGTLFLYLNNTHLTKKTHGAKKRLPSHFVVLLSLAHNEDLVTLTYWDYGGRTRQQVSPAFLKKIIFGISHSVPKSTHAL